MNHYCYMGLTSYLSIGFGVWYMSTDFVTPKKGTPFWIRFWIIPVAVIFWPKYKSRVNEMASFGKLELVSNRDDDE